MTTPARTDSWIWPLIYGGLIVFAWGVAVWRQDADAAGPWMVAAGAVCAMIGAVLVVRRSRRPDARAATADVPPSPR